MHKICKCAATHPLDDLQTIYELCFTDVIFSGVFLNINNEWESRDGYKLTLAASKPAFMSRSNVGTDSIVCRLTERARRMDCSWRNSKKSLEMAFKLELRQKNVKIVKIEQEACGHRAAPKFVPRSGF